MITKIRLFILAFFAGIQQHMSKALEAVKIVNGIKALINNPSLDVITAMTKSNVDDKVLMKARSIVNLVAEKLLKAEGILTSEDPHREGIVELVSILRDIPTEEGRKKYFIELAAMIAEALIDKKLSFAELVLITQTAFKFNK